MDAEESSSRAVHGAHLGSPLALVGAGTCHCPFPLVPLIRFRELQGAILLDDGREELHPFPRWWGPLPEVLDERHGFLVKGEQSFV